MAEGPPAERKDATSTHLRTAAACVLAAEIASVTLIAIAAAHYPGGTWMDRRTRGHDLAHNFLCDLLAPVALDGTPNPVGAVAATAGLLTLAAGIGLFWQVLPALFPGRPRLGAGVRAAGLLSLVGMVAVPLTPSARAGALHAVAIFAAGIPGLVAAMLGVAGLLGVGRPERRIAALGAATIVVVLIDGALYTEHSVQAGAPSPALPFLQRIASLLLLAWLSAVAVRVLRAPTPRPPG